MALFDVMSEKYCITNIHSIAIQLKYYYCKYLDEEKLKK